MGIAESVVLLVLAIGMLILIHFCVTKRAIRRAFGNGGMMVEGNAMTSASRRIDLEKLPSFDFREKEVGSSPVCCAICLNNFRGSDKCRLLPICKHSFHMECVDKWLLAKAHCPICRGSANSMEMAENTVGLNSRSEGIAELTSTVSGPVACHQNDRSSPES